MSWDKDLKIKQVDNIISQLKSNKNFHLQKEGWLKLIRTTLGMSARALGERVKLTQSRIALIEKGEIDGSITLNTLEKVSNGLDCDVVYFLVPKTGSFSSHKVETTGFQPVSFSCDNMSYRGGTTWITDTGVIRYLKLNTILYG